MPDEAALTVSTYSLCLLSSIVHLQCRMNLFRQCPHIRMDSFHPVLKIPYSIHNSIALILCFDCLDMPFNVQTPVSTVLTNIVFNALHTLIFLSTVSTNKIPYSIHNSIALILCINSLDVPFNVHTTDKVTMITVSQFLTI